MEFKVGDRVKGNNKGRYEYEYKGTILHINEDNNRMGIRRDDGDEGCYNYGGFRGLWSVDKKDDGTYGSDGNTGILIKISNKLLDVKNKIMEKGETK